MQTTRLGLPASASPPGAFSAPCSGRRRPTPPSCPAPGPPPPRTAPAAPSAQTPPTSAAGRASAHVVLFPFLRPPPRSAGRTIPVGEELLPRCNAPEPGGRGACPAIDPHRVQPERQASTAYPKEGTPTERTKKPGAALIGLGPVHRTVCRIRNSNSIS